VTAKVEIRVDKVCTKRYSHFSSEIKHAYFMHAQLSVQLQAPTTVMELHEVDGRSLSITTVGAE
jgi:hypothetical protein